MGGGGGKAYKVFQWTMVENVQNMEKDNKRTDSQAGWTPKHRANKSTRRCTIANPWKLKTMTSWKQTGRNGTLPMWKPVALSSEAREPEGIWVMCCRCWEKNYQLQILDTVKIFFRCKGKALESCIDQGLIPGICKDFQNPLSKTNWLENGLYTCMVLSKNYLIYKKLIRKLQKP